MDKEKLEKIVEKILKRNQAIEDFMDQMGKYALNQKDTEFLESLPKTLSDIEKSHDKLAKVVEGFVKDLESATKKTSREVQSDKKERPTTSEVESPLEIAEEPVLDQVADPEPVTVEEPVKPTLVDPEWIKNLTNNTNTDTIKQVEPASAEATPVNLEWNNDFANNNENVETKTPVVEQVTTPTPVVVEEVKSAESAIPEPMVLEDAPVMTL